MITRLDGRYPFADRFDDTTCFMTENAWKETFGVMAVEGVDVCVAESVSDDFDTDFSCFGWVYGDGFFREGLLGCAGDHGRALDWFSYGAHCSYLEIYCTEDKASMCVYYLLLHFSVNDTTVLLLYRTVHYRTTIIRQHHDLNQCQRTNHNVVVLMREG